MGKTTAQCTVCLFFIFCISCATEKKINNSTHTKNQKTTEIIQKHSLRSLFKKIDLENISIYSEINYFLNTENNEFIKIAKD
ncbi:MAG: hypothetical protein ACRCTJ_06675, partial [Brevinema sp.]